MYKYKYHAHVCYDSCNSTNSDHTRVADNQEFMDKLILQLLSFQLLISTNKNVIPAPADSITKDMNNTKLFTIVQFGNGYFLDTPDTKEKDKPLRNQTVINVLYI